MGKSLATIIVIYMISFFLAVCFGMIATVPGNETVFVIYVSILAIWILVANIIIAVRLRKFQGMILSISERLAAQFALQNDCFSE